MTEKTEIVPEEETEIILSESPGGEPGGTPRTLRVYDSGGDFLIEIPSEARVTFGYFNPAAAGPAKANQYGGYGPGTTTMKTTALRVYADSTDKRQIAAFLGVNGFRDQTLVKLTRLKQKVIIESNFEDDGVGRTKHHSEQMRQLVQHIEDEEPPF